MGADPKGDNFPMSFNSGTLASAAEGSTSDDQNGDVAASVEQPTTFSSVAVGNKLLNRFLASKNTEALSLRIAVNNYHPIFTPNTAEAFAMPRDEREGSEGAVKGADETEGERGNLVRERFLLMNEGMKGLSREEVEGRNGGFGSLVGDGDGEKVDGKGVGEGSGDVEMVQ